jgi:hypothetical protein
MENFENMTKRPTTVLPHSGSQNTRRSVLAGGAALASTPFLSQTSKAAAWPDGR